MSLIEPTPMSLDDDIDDYFKKSELQMTDDVSRTSDSSNTIFEEFENLHLGLRRKTSILDILHRKSISFE